MNKIACALFSFDRPLYLKKTLQSIYENHAKHNIFDNIDLYFFQDGSTINNSREVGSKEKINQSIKIIKEYQNKFPKAEVDISNINLGIAKQKQKAHLLFEKYNKILFFEDDMILSPHYIKLVISMSEQFPNSIVQACDRTGRLPKNDFKNHLNKVIKSGCHFWGYLMNYTVHDKVKNLLNDYINFIGNDYRKRPSNAIRQRYNIHTTSHDAIIHKAINEQNISKITTIVPRAKYIGKEGMHANLKWFEKYNFHIEKPYIFEEDKHINQFEIQK